MFFRFCCDNAHASGIIAQDFVDDVEIHCFCFVVHAVSMAGLEALWGKWWTP
ncbi:hypothetical protein BOW91_gp177 [Synechococcus phage S-WAM2]|uniref:Uncharacterized protein n=1 Tax=Synechococcus phage S-WAM2 TaxID=1815522 RepID=A0A1D8KSW0_9CAUD|nr:hypothetical protein BOW91_gp177 [Synechococcus phage S-WAM2]AOV61770.1 hypothetical protein P29B0810_074 [Synechococcus phage S-WAM2]